MYATTEALLCSHAVRRARPRPFWGRCRARTQSSSWASPHAMAQVLSLLALSATVMSHERGKFTGEIAVKPSIGVPGPVVRYTPARRFRRYSAWRQLGERRLDGEGHGGAHS